MAFIQYLFKTRAWKRRRASTRSPGEHIKRAWGKGLSRGFERVYESLPHKTVQSSDNGKIKRTKSGKRRIR